MLALAPPECKWETARAAGSAEIVTTTVAV